MKVRKLNLINTKRFRNLTLVNKNKPEINWFTEALIKIDKKQIKKEKK